MKEIPLSRGIVALVDDADFEWLNQYKWHVSPSDGKHLYAAARINGKYIRMHKVLSPDVMVDHRDGNGLNNQRLNLRPATDAQNSRNTKKRNGTTSRFKGVYWDKQHRKWRTQIAVLPKRFHIGLFHSEEEAAKAYDSAAMRLFGEFAKTNFPS